jgi:hypothetical protein
MISFFVMSLSNSCGSVRPLAGNTRSSAVIGSAASRIRRRAHKSWSHNRCFQILCSRRLKLDGFHDIGNHYLPTMLECRLRPEDISFAKLGERKSFRALDSIFKLFSGKTRAEPPVVLAA